jgi:hypothetical protein
MRQPLPSSRLPDNETFARRFYDLFTYFVQLVDLGYALNLSQ